MHIGRVRRAGLDGPVARLVGVLPGDRAVVDLATAEAHRLRRLGAEWDAAQRISGALFPGSLTAALRSGDAFRSALEVVMSDRIEEATLSWDDIDWLPPVDPPVMRDSSAFELHLLNAHKRGNRPVPGYFYEVPVYYKMNPVTIAGAGMQINWCSGSRFLDYELELAIVIGRGGRDLDPDTAGEHIFGYSIMNDFSARDIQAREMSSGFGPAKSKDFATAVGPWVTTADSLDVRDLTMISRVNGEERSRGSTSEMMWSVAEIVAFLSQSENLAAGEVIGSGTIGFGSGLELFKKLQPGDTVELEIVGVGVLTNRVGARSERSWEPAPRVPSHTEPEVVG